MDDGRKERRHASANRECPRATSSLLPPRRETNRTDLRQTETSISKVNSWGFFVQRLCSLYLCGLTICGEKASTETWRTQTLHKEVRLNVYCGPAGFGP